MTTDIQQHLAPSRIGQGTAVEQSRAIAEVQAAIVVAQQVPRDITRAERDMRRSCGQKSLAEKAFFRFPRGRETISGPSVQLARELARCFGNMQYGVTELRRDDSYGQSEMQAWAWDVQTNTRSSTTFIVPHVRDTRSGSSRLVDQRDIYENNANNGARRLREMIFAILPGWYTEDAIAACYDTLASCDDGTLAERADGAVEGFAKLGVTAAQLEQKLGGPVAKWTPYDLAQLQVIYRSLMRGEIRKEDEFPSAGGVTAAEITGQNGHSPDVPSAEAPAPPARATPPRSGSAEGTPTHAPDAGATGSTDGPATREPARSGQSSSGQRSAIGKELDRIDVADPEERLGALSSLTGRQIDALADLSADEARGALRDLKGCGSRAELFALTDAGDKPGGSSE